MDPLSNLTALRADSLELWDDQAASYISVLELVTGFPPATMNTLELLAQAIGNDPDFFESVSNDLETKADSSYVNAQLGLVNAAIGTKSDSSFVNEQLGLVSSALDTKTSRSYVDSELEALDADIAAKASLTVLASELATRDTLISARATTAVLNSELAARDAAILAKTSISTTSALTARVTGVERVVTAEDGVSYNYLETGEDALVIRGENEIAANFLGASAGALEGSVLFYKNLTTFGITTNPTLQTTLVRARDAAGVVVTTSSGTTVLQSSEDGDLVVPHDLQCTGEVVASGLRANSFTHNGTLLSTQLDSKENEFDVTSPLQKVLDTDGFIGLRIDPGADLEVTDLHLRGNLTLDGSMPSAFFRAGKVNADTTVATSAGRNVFTVDRSNGDPVGRYKVDFGETHSRGAAYVYTIFVENETSQSFCTATIEDLASTFIRIAVKDEGGTLTNRAFHIMVL